MKTKILLLVLLLSLFSNLYAQVNLDPGHKIYSDIYTWENRRYLKNLPSFKPYTLEYLKKILNQVINRGNEKDVIKAKAYLLECENRISGTFEMFTYLGSIDNGAVSSALLTGRGAVMDGISVAVRAGSYFTTDESDISTLPLYRRRGLDYNTDTSNIGPLELMSTWDSNIAFGNDIIWFQAGLGKTSYGPFTGDNIIMSSDAPQSAYYSLTADFGNITYNKSFHQIVATDLEGDDLYTSKFLSSNGLTWQALPWLNMGIFDSVTFGDRFDAAYLLPMTQLMYTQGFNGFVDNAMIGVTGEIEFPKNINLKGALLVDDFAFNDAIKLNFDSKYKFAIETYLNWAPEFKFLDQIEIGYKMLTPHMYTHEPEGYRIDGSTRVYDYTSDGDENINYLNYTNKGESMGSSLLPNSDQVSLTTKLDLPFGIGMNFFAYFTRNANSSDSLPDSYNGMDIIKNENGSYFIDVNGDGIYGSYYVNENDEYLTVAQQDTLFDVNPDNDAVFEWSSTEPLFLGDGSLNDHGVIIKDRYGIQDHWIYIWQDSFPFLIQNYINYTFQTGLGLSKKWNLDFTEISVDLDYTFQIHNGDINNFVELGISLEL